MGCPKYIEKFITALSLEERPSIKSLILSLSKGLFKGDKKKKEIGSLLCFLKTTIK
jgi:hypothetical protein